MVLFTDHAEERMVERDITRRMVLNALSCCELLDGPSWQPTNANWESKVVGTAAGVRIAIVCAVKDGDLIVTIVTTHHARH